MHIMHIMQCDVAHCVICTSNNVEYLAKKEQSHKNCIKELSHVVN